MGTVHLGLYLFYIDSTMGIKNLCLIFGITPTVYSRVINQMLSLVVQKLNRHPLASVKFPDVEQMAILPTRSIYVSSRLMMKLASSMVLLL
jgi:septum formation inhibitor-activating ATPase MinD